MVLLGVAPGPECQHQAFARNVSSKTPPHPDLLNKRLWGWSPVVCGNEPSGACYHFRIFAFKLITWPVQEALDKERKKEKAIEKNNLKTSFCLLIYLFQLEKNYIIFCVYSCSDTLQ